MIIVQQRFPHAHEDDVGNTDSEFPLRGIDLREDFGSTQVPCAAVDGRCTERTSHITANLRGDTDGIAVFVLHKYGLDNISVLHLIEIFDGPVNLGSQLQDCFCIVNDIVLCERLPQFFRKVGHFRKTGDILLMKPGVDLPCTEFRKTECQHVLGQFRKGHTPDIFSFCHWVSSFSKTAL